MASTLRRKLLVAETSNDFQLVAGRWQGPCLFCGRRLSMDARSGEGASLEHIRPRSDGGDDALLNLALAHAHCNGEKGRRTDNPRARRADPARYERIVGALLARRAAAFRPPAGADDSLTLVTQSADAAAHADHNTDGHDGQATERRRERGRARR